MEMLSQTARATNYGQFTQITLSSDGIPLFQGQGVFAVSIAATLPLLGRVDLVPPKLQSACSRAHRVPVRLGLQSIKQIESHMIILEKFLCAQLRPSTTPIFISIFLWSGMPFSSRGLFPSPIRYQHKTNGSAVQKAVRSPARGQEGGKNEAEEETRCANNMGHRHGNQSKSELLFHAEIAGRKPGNVALLNSPCKYGFFLYLLDTGREADKQQSNMHDPGVVCSGGFVLLAAILWSSCARHRTADDFSMQPFCSGCLLAHVHTHTSTSSERALNSAYNV